MLPVSSHVRYKFRINTLMLCHLDIALKGLNARRVLSDLNADISSPPVASAIRLAKEICGKKKNPKQGYLNVSLFDSIKSKGKCLRSSYLLQQWQNLELSRSW